MIWKIGKGFIIMPIISIDRKILIYFPEYMKGFDVLERYILQNIFFSSYLFSMRIEREQMRELDPTCTYLIKINFSLDSQTEAVAFFVA